MLNISLNLLDCSASIIELSILLATIGWTSIKGLFILLAIKNQAILLIRL